MKLYIQGHFSRVALGDLDVYLNNSSGLIIDPILTEFAAELPSGTINDFLSISDQSYIIIDGRLYAMGVFKEGPNATGIISIDGVSGLVLEPLLLNAGTGLETGWTSIHRPNYSAQGFYAINGTKLYFWGVNGAYSGLPTTTNQITPSVEQIAAGTLLETGWETVSSGYNYSLGIRDGKLYFWGSSNTDIGLGTTPTQVGTDDNWVMVSCGRTHALAINNLGELYAWGSNANYATGIGTQSGSTLTPTQVGLNNDWELCSAGNEVSMGIRNDGAVYSWGANVNTGLGLKLDDADVIYPTEIAGVFGDRIIDIQNSASNWNHTVVLTRTGERYIWGDLNQLYLGDTIDSVPETSLLFPDAAVPHEGLVIAPLKMDTFEDILWDKIKVSYYTFMGLGSPIVPTPTPTPTPSADNLSGVNNLFVEWT